MRTRTWIGVAVVAAALVAGCSGDDGADTADGTTTTAAEPVDLGELVPFGATPAPASPIRAVEHDTSPPLTEMAVPEFVPRTGDDEAEERLPKEGPGARAVDDPVAQRSPTRLEGGDPLEVVASFDGVGKGFTGPDGTHVVRTAPPDTNAAVGPDHIVQTVNVDFAVFDKEGAVLLGPRPMNSLWAGFGGDCETHNDGDPVVAYDRLADRWVMSQFAVTLDQDGPFWECLAVSTSADPLGSYHRYAFEYIVFPDFPKLSVWTDAYYVTYNLYTEQFAGAGACALERAAMLEGREARQQCFTMNDQYVGLLAADVDSSTAPPEGRPVVIVGRGARLDALPYWTYAPDFDDPDRTVVTATRWMPVADFFPACGGRDCVVQPGTDTKLEAMGSVPMFRLAYRNQGDREALVLTHAVDVPGGTTGIRWYEMDLDADGAPSVRQQGTWAPDDTYRFLSSAAMDRQGNIAIGYSASSATVPPSLRAAGRRAGDPEGSLTQGELVLQAGGGSQTVPESQGGSRWGDYASMSVDPSDDCTFWFTSEYMVASGAEWSTRIVGMRFPECT